ncbi:lysylphosphatidylglycerol synthase domain-containing protein [Bacillus sp. CGMCC 1.16607]|uniref:lysylphosphatidylglycerol synthase domain-containing protein n=1 Tax=Bacillus sp. CGMCC 1.16607 TaxID=3351842 RepID=UPI0036297BC7
MMIFEENGVYMLQFFKNKKWLPLLKLTIPFGLLFFLLWEGKKFTKDIDVHLLQKHMNELGLYHVILILIIGLISVNIMSFYDLILKKRLHMNIPIPLLFQYSFISNTMSNLFGFGGFAGSALRTYFYQKYKQDRMDVIKGIAELSAFYLSGLSILCWCFLLGPLDHSMLIEYRWLFFAVWGIAIYLPVMLLVLYFTKRINIFQKQERRFTYSLLLISTLEWLFVFITIFMIAKVLGISVSFSETLSIGIVAASAGVISMIPGGLGSFDFIFMIGLSNLGVFEEQALLLLLLYRISYYFFPFFIGLFMLIRHFWKQLNVRWSGLPTVIIGNVSHFFVTILVFCSGVILLLSASLPAIIERIKFMDRLLSMPIMNLSHLLSIGVGITLLGLARGIEYKVKRAYYLTFIMLIVGAIFTFSKNFDYEEALFVLFVAFVLWLSRQRFYRENFVYTWGRILFDVVVLFIVLGFS